MTAPPTRLRVLAVAVALSALASMTAGEGSATPEVPIVGEPSHVPGVAREATINLQVAREVRDVLEEAGLTVLMTRESDVTLDRGDRTGLANRREVDAFVSIHHNASTTRSANGTIVFRSIRSDGSWQLGDAITDGFRDEFGDERSISLTTRRGCCGDYYYQLRQTTMPAVLVEGAFVSHREEGKRLADDESFRSAIATSIASGILAYQSQINTGAGTSRDPGTVIPYSHVPVLDVRAIPLGATRVKVRFTTPDVAGARYRVYRDGVLIAQPVRESGKRTSFTDRSASPGQTYSYEVRTAEEVAPEIDVWREAPSAPVEATTPALSVVLDPGHGGRDPGAFYRY